LNSLLFLPASQIGDNLSMIIHKIISLQVLFIPILDSFEHIVVRIEVVAGFEEGGLRQFDLLGLVLLEEEVKH